MFRLGNLTMARCTTVALILASVLLLPLGCGQDGLIQPHNDTNILPPSSSDFRAMDFPTNNGSAWTYINADTEQEFTLRIEGTRDIKGFTHRQMTISEMRPPQFQSVNREAVEHLSANALYFRFNSDDFFGYAFPIFATYFLKTPQTYVESAFDAYLPGLANPVFHEQHFPHRLIWDFPLKLGKEWIVFEKTTIPATRVIRRVVGVNEALTVSAGSYTAYVIEEEIVGAEGIELSGTDSNQLFSIPPARYWVVPTVGVVKYEYTEFFGLEAPALREFELKSADLPAANTR